jgi:hypothetical protein
MKRINGRRLEDLSEVWRAGGKKRSGLEDGGEELGTGGAAAKMSLRAALGCAQGVSTRFYRPKFYGVLLIRLLPASTATDPCR